MALQSEVIDSIQKATQHCSNDLMAINPIVTDQALEPTLEVSAVTDDDDEDDNAV